MSRSKRSADLETRNKRLALKAGQDHTETLSAGHYIIYRRPATGGNGSWRARWRDPETGKFISRQLGFADDLTEIDGVNVVDWSQIQKRAEGFFKDCARKAHLLATGESVSDGPYTVGAALRDHLAEAARLGQETATLKARIDAIILPEFDTVPVSKLTKKKIQDWHERTASSPRRKTGRGVSEAREDWGKVPPTAEQLRARKVTANRNLAILKRALNLAVEENHISGDYTPWRDAMPFGKVNVSRVRFLSVSEQQRLVAACSSEFRPMVQAALFTGSRYGPLCRMKVSDFDPRAETVWISKDKRGASRHVHLAPEAVSWFKRMTKGRDGEDLLLQRKEVKRVTRVGQEENWAAGDQDWQLTLACRAANLKPLTFHEFRHTYASGLVNAGMPLAFVAAQLGHKDTRMVERYYGHLCPTAMKESIRSLSPVLGIGKPSKQTAAKNKR